MVGFSQMRWEQRQRTGKQRQMRSQFFPTGQEKRQTRWEQPERMGRFSNDVATSAGEGAANADVVAMVAVEAAANADEVVAGSFAILVV